MPSKALIPFFLVSSLFAREALSVDRSSQRIVAIGDLHGDYAAAIQALRLGGAIDDKDRWIGGTMIVVQTGDEIDRGDDDRKIIDLFERLRIEAKASGGAVHPLCGNHETMNVYADFRYVTDGAFKDFTENVPSTYDPIPNLPSDQQARAAAFAPGGSYAKILATRPIMLTIGDSAFVHGGIRAEHVAAGMETMNQQVADWMLGKTERPAFVKDSNGPLWMRNYSEAKPKAEDCAMLKNALGALGVKRMVVGHTVQEKGINAACDNQVWRIDVGLSKYYGSQHIQVLEISGDQTRVLSAPRK